MDIWNLITGDENKQRFNEAKELNELAESSVEYAREKFEDAQKSCQRSLKHLDLQKQKLYKGAFAIFATSVTAIKNARFSLPKELAELDKYTNGMAFFYPYVDINTGIWESSWGRVIGTSLAGTGLGVLGMNAYLSKKSQIALDNAKSAYAESELAVEQLEMATEVCGYIEARTKMFSQALDKLTPLYVNSVLKLKEIIAKNGTDFETYNNDEQKSVAVAVTLSKSIKAILDIAILNKDGSLSKESKELAIGLSKDLQIPCDVNALGCEDTLIQDDFDSDSFNLFDSKNKKKLVYCDSYDGVVKIISQKLGIPSSDFNMYTSFTQLNIDQVKFTEIKKAVEDKFRMHISQKAEAKIKTVEDLTDCVVEKLDDTFREVGYVANKILESKTVQDIKTFSGSFVKALFS